MAPKRAFGIGNFSTFCTIKIQDWRKPRKIMLYVTHTFLTMIKTLTLFLLMNKKTISPEVLENAYEADDQTTPNGDIDVDEEHFCLLCDMIMKE